MISRISLLLLAVLLTVQGSDTDTIKVEMGVLGNAFYYKEQPVRFRSDLKYLLIWSPEAYRDFKATRPLYTAKISLLACGSTLLGFSLVQGAFAAFSKSPFYWQVGAIGAGATLLTIPLHFRYNRKITGAVEVYNRGVLTKLTVGSVRVCARKI
jgi:hypothetical protein